jgi:hypothetical protein
MSALHLYTSSAQRTSSRSSWSATCLLHSGRVVFILYKKLSAIGSCTQNTVCLQDVVITDIGFEMDHTPRTRAQTHRSNPLKSAIGLHYEQGHKSSLKYIRDGNMLIFPINEHKLRHGRPIKIRRGHQEGNRSDEDGTPIVL